VDLHGEVLLFVGNLLKENRIKRTEKIVIKPLKMQFIRIAFFYAKKFKNLLSKFTTFAPSKNTLNDFTSNSYPTDSRRNSRTF
jgi:hypothetical protein